MSTPPPPGEKPPPDGHVLPAAATQRHVAGPPMQAGAPDPSHPHGQDNGLYRGQTRTTEHSGVGRLVWRRAVLVLAMVVLGVLVVMLESSLRQEEPWDLAIIGVLVGGLLSMFEYQVMADVLRRGASSRSVGWAMAAGSVITAVGGLGIMLFLGMLVVEARTQEAGQALTHTEGWLALLLWQLASATVGYVAGLAAALTSLADSGPAQARYGGYAVPAVLLLIAMPVGVLLTPGLLAWPGVVAAAVVTVAAALVLRAALRAATREAVELSRPAR